MEDASYFLVIRLGPKTSECEKNVTVTGCDVTNCATTIITRVQQAKKTTEGGKEREVRVWCDVVLCLFLFLFLSLLPLGYAVMFFLFIQNGSSCNLSYSKNSNKADPAT